MVLDIERPRNSLERSIYRLNFVTFGLPYGSRIIDGPEIARMDQLECTDPARNGFSACSTRMEWLA